jgi:PAS domain S-box-containing protein
MQDDFFRSILVVDDDDGFRDMIQRILVKTGYHCQIAADADHALNCLGHQHFDLVLSDIMMKGKDGIALMKEARGIYSHLEFVMMTGYSLIYSYSDIIAAGAMDYLIKPFPMSDLEARLERIRWQKWTAQELKRHQNHLEELVKERTAQLETEIKERERVEEALRAAERKYRSIFENSLMGIYQSAPGGSYITANQAFAEILGYDSPEDLIDSITNIADQVYANPQDRQRVMRSLCEHEAQTFEIEVRRKDGSRGWLSNHVRVVRDDHGNIVHFDGLVEDITERKQIEEALRESEERYRLIFNHAPLGIMHFDQNGVVQDFNDKFAEIIGDSRERILGFNMLANLRDPAFIKAVKDALDGKLGYYEGDYLSVLGDKTTPLRAFYTRITAQDGRFLGAVGLFEDITAPKLAEEALRESEARFRKFAEEASFEGIFFHHEGQILDVNETFARMSGYARSELIGMNLRDLVAPEFRELVQSNLFAEHEVAYEIIGLRKDGSTFPVEIQAKTISYLGKMVRAVAVRDISERKRSEEALQAANQRLLDIIEFLPDATLVIDRQGTVLAWNRAMEEMTGVSKEDIVGKGNHACAIPLYGQPRPMLVDYMINDNIKLEHLYDRLERSGNTLYTELYAPGILDGRGGYLGATASPLFDRHGKVTGAIESLRDITERREMESALLRREKELETKSMDLEEINTALRVVLKRREEDQKELGENLLSNMKELIFPYLEKLKNSHPNERQRTYLGILESHLQDIGAPFLRKLSREFTKLSPMELQIATLIKEGKRNKEIAEILGVSVNTVLTHRYHLRTKLGLKNKDINLISYLKSITT